MRSFPSSRVVRLLVLCAAFLAGTSSLVQAQANKDKKKPAPKFKDEQADRSLKAELAVSGFKVGEDRADGKFGSEEELQRMKDYYTKQFSRWSFDINLAQIPDLRGRFFMDFRDAYEKTPKDAHASMNEFFLAELQKMAADEKLDYVVRYNAVLQLGELNSVELTKTGQGNEEALAAALPVLLALYEKADNHPAVRMAALVGLLRHAKLGIDDDAQRKSLQTALFALLNQTEAGEDVDDDAHLYLRRRAAQGLGWLGLAGVTDNGREVFDALVAIVKDDEQTLPFRADAARALGDLRLQGVAGVDVADLVQTLGALALEAVESGGDDILETSKFDGVAAEKVRPILFCLKNVKLALRGASAEEPTGGLAQLDGGEKTNQLLKELAEKLEQLPSEQKEEKEPVLIATKVGRIRDLLAGEPAAAEGEGDAAAEGDEGDAAGEGGAAAGKSGE